MSRGRFILLAGIILVWGSLFAQQRQNADLMRIYEKYGKARFKMDIQYLFYPTYQAASPIEEQYMQLSAWESNVWMKSKDFELVRNENQMLYVNNRDKLMILQSVEGKKLQAMANELQGLINMDSILSRYNNLMLRETDEDIKTYRLHYGSDQSRIAYLDLTINSKKDIIEKITVYFSKQMDQMFFVQDEAHKKGKPKMVITYSNCVFPPKMDKDEFTFFRYFTIAEDGQISATGAFKAYKIIDHSIKSKRKKK